MREGEQLPYPDFLPNVSGTGWMIGNVTSYL